MRRRIVEFVHELRGLGLSIGVDQAVSFAESFEWIQVLNRQEVHAAGRATLVNRFESLQAYDTAFEAFWERLPAGTQPQRTPQAPRHRPSDFQRSTLVSFMAAKAKADSQEIELTDRTDTATHAEILQRKDFSQLTDEERRALRRSIASLRWDFCKRRTHRLTSDSRGQMLDHREVLRRAAKLGGTAMDLPTRRRKDKPRPLVLIADVSGSMELYSRIVLQFFHGLSQELRETEAFVFGTRLTRVTDALGVRDPDRALDVISSEVRDFAGGTRIADSLHTFRHRFGYRMRRGSVVVVVSDGCETGDVDALAREAAALQRSCYRLIWLNPRLGAPNYEPKVQGMAAVLPYVDDFMSIHNFESLRQLRDHLSRLPKRKGGPSEVSRRL
ncbi:MAG: VWA domain-containing protein [Myxococcota bacterium]